MKLLKRRGRFTGMLLMGCLIMFTGGGPTMGASPQEPVRAKPFPEGLPWLNTERPLQFDVDLRGQVVVLDFWTYACINCIHMIPVLRQVEEHYKDAPVTVIGVHTNKFDNESEAANIRTALLRYGVRHPVVVDSGQQVWDAYGVSAWPTFVFINARGEVVQALSGERDAQTFIDIIDPLLAEGREQKVLAAKPLTLRPEGSVPSSSGLAFPGKVLADATSNRLFIADSNHHRIIEASLGGEIRAIYGSGKRGRADGGASMAEFANPQGMALDSAANLLFVADTDNHALRQIDLKTGEVTTLAGTGRQGYDRSGGRKGPEQDLASPWDVAVDGNRVFIAMAGLHQIWVYDRGTQVASAWSGSGMEEIFDGPANHAALAQPSGLSFGGEHLYFADSEVSALRRASLATGEVETIVGTGLFDFGDGEGLIAQTRFQHPLGVAAGKDVVYVADTYNHKVKAVDLKARRSSTVLGLEVGLYEPGGLSLADDLLFVADTNNHRIVIHDLKSGRTRELALTNWPQSARKQDDSASRQTLEWPVLAAGMPVDLKLDLKLAKGTKINPLAPMTLRMAPADESSGEGIRFQQTIDQPALPATIQLDLPDGEGSAEHHLDLTFAYCTEEDAMLCAPVHLRWRVIIRTAQSGGAREVLVQSEIPGR